MINNDIKTFHWIQEPQMETKLAADLFELLVEHFTDRVWQLDLPCQDTGQHVA